MTNDGSRNTSGACDENLGFGRHEYDEVMVWILIVVSLSFIRRCCLFMPYGKQRTTEDLLQSYDTHAYWRFSVDRLLAILNSILAIN